MKRLLAIFAVVLVLWFPLSAANKTVTVKPSGGTYTTLAAAIAGELVANANLVTMAGILHIEIGGTWAAADTAAASTDGFTTSAVYYLHIYTDASNRASASWSTSKYQLLVANAKALAISDADFCRIDGLQIGKSTSNADDQACIGISSITAGSDIRVSNCLLKQAGNVSYNEPGILIQDGDANLNLWNTIVYGLGGKVSSSNSGITSTAAGAINIYSSVFSGGYKGVFRDSTGTWTLKNVYAGNTGGADFDGTLTETNCASEDATAGGTNHTHAAYGTDTFVAVAAGSEDFHLAADGLSPLQVTGVDTTGDAAPLNFTTDIDGDTRDATWDIGADAVVVAGGATIINNILIIIHLPRFM